MNAKQQKTLGVILLGAAALFLLWVVIFSNIVVTEATSLFVVNQNTWTTDFMTNIQANGLVYLGFVVVLGFGYFLLTKKRKRK